MPDIKNIGYHMKLGYNRSLKNLGKVSQRVITGLKHPSADEGLGMEACANRLQQVLKGTEALQSAISNGKGVLELQDVSIQNATDIIDRIITVASSALDSTKAPEDLAILNSEALALIKELNYVASTPLQYNSTAVLGATSINIKYGIGASDTLDIGGINLSTATLAATNYAATDATWAQSLLNDALGTAPGTSSNFIIQQARTTIASNMRRLSAIEESIDSNQANYANTISEIRDIDVAKEAAEYSLAQMGLLLGQSVLNQNNGMLSSALKFFS